MKALILLLLTAVPTFAANTKFECNAFDLTQSLVAELDIANEFAKISLQGPVVAEVVKDFSEKPMQPYDKLTLKAPTAETKCPFQREWLNFQCT